MLNVNCLMLNLKTNQNNNNNKENKKKRDKVKINTILYVSKVFFVAIGDFTAFLKVENFLGKKKN